jgi:uncharacterized surface protein with fasciclin (FAS1) repeats
MRTASRSIVLVLATLALVAGVVGSAIAGPGKPGTQTITEIAAASDDFDYLVAALQATGLDEALDSDDSTYTVFAPTDAAFERVADELAIAGVGDGTVGTLLTFLVQQGLADDVLLYHVADGRRFSNSVLPKAGTRSIATLLGPRLWVTTAGQVVDASPATSNAAIAVPDINASNGVIHVIDDVLVPLS